MNRFHKAAAGLTLAATLATSLAVSAPAQASTEGRKNTAIALGAVALHQLLTGKTTNGLLAGAATAYAYDRYKDSKKDDDRAERWERYNRAARRYDSRRSDRSHRSYRR